MGFLARVCLRNLEWLALNGAMRIYWGIVALLFFSTMACGLHGWLNYELIDETYKAKVGSNFTVLELAHAIQLSAKALFSSDIYSTTPIDVMPLSLAITRVTGAFFFALIAGRIIIFSFGGRVGRAFVRARAGHDVIIGDHAAASAYAQQLKAKAIYLSGSELESFGRVARLRRRGDVKQDLKDAGASRARRILIAMNSDIETWSVAQQVSKLIPSKEVLAHILDPWLLERISNADSSSLPRKPFSITTGAARQIMLAHPPYLLARAIKAPKQHIVIVGFTALGQAIAREFLITSVSVSPADMMITIIDPDAKRLAKEFTARHMGLSDEIDISFVAGALTERDETIDSYFAERCQTCAPCAVYVAWGVDKAPLGQAVAIKERAGQLAWFKAPIFVNCPTDSGLMAARQGVGVLGADSENEPADRLYSLRLTPFGGAAAALDGAELLGGDYDLLARRFHEAYHETQTDRQKDKRVENEWDYLSEEFKISNRRVAAHIRAVLDAAGFPLGKWLEEVENRRCSELPSSVEALDLDNVELMEKLAELQHRRWVIDRLLNGWRYGEKRDNGAKRHDCLIPYADLADNVKEFDRQMVRKTKTIIEGASK